jgi:hypothetical protein
MERNAPLLALVEALQSDGWKQSAGGGTNHLNNRGIQLNTLTDARDDLFIQHYLPRQSQYHTTRLYENYNFLATSNFNEKLNSTYDFADDNSQYDPFELIRTVEILSPFEYEI